LTCHRTAPTFLLLIENSKSPNIRNGSIIELASSYWRATTDAG
jgi:hypothetical protein